MATRLTVQNLVSGSGITPSTVTPVAATDYVFANDGKVWLEAIKTGAGACTVTVTTARTVSGQAVGDQTDTVAATTGNRRIGPFEPADYNDSNGDVTVQFSEVTGLTVVALRCP